MLGKLKDFFSSFKPKKPYPIPKDTQVGINGKPIKNKLPGYLKDSFKTKTQWLEVGREIKEKEVPIEMLANASGKCKTYEYYHISQTRELNSSSRTCASCSHREGYYCIFAGDYVAMTSLCSEWER